MIAIDTNLLVYAHREDSPFHSAALTVLCDLAGGGRRWAIPWPCLHEFISVVTHPQIYVPPSPIAIALASVDQWINSPSCELIGEGPTYFDRLKALCVVGKVAGPMVHDARIAALCLDNGVSELWSADRDFSRFADLKIRNPLLK